MVEGAEGMSFQGLWFVVAGFILGFATSTLWEWLYYRGKRRAKAVGVIPSMPPSTHGGERPEETVAEPLLEPPKAAWVPPYRSPGVYLESEQVVPSQPLAPTIAATPVTAIARGDQANPHPPTDTFPADGTAPRLNPATLATLQAAIAQTPIAQPTTHTRVYTAPRIEALSAQMVEQAEPSAPPPAPLPPEKTADTNLPPATYLLPPQSLTAPAPSLPAAEKAPALVHTAAVPAEIPSAAPPARPPSSEAGNRADHPDDLALIKGVGEAYKRRLYHAGIYTWRQVAESDTETLRRITRAKPNANISGWLQQARELAEKYQRWHSTFQGPLDDFTRIDGIGAITADILYKAGICTYEQLASALPDELAKIVPAPTVGDEIDFDGWINTAVRLANTKRRNQGVLA